MFVKKGAEKFLVALLTKERPQASINVYITLDDNVQLVVEGNGTIHITGYFEPEGQDDLPFGEEFGDESEDEEGEENEDEESEEEEVVVPAKPTPAIASKGQPQVQAKQNAQKPKTPVQPVAAAQEDSEDD